MGGCMSSEAAARAPAALEVADRAAPAQRAPAGARAADRTVPLQPQPQPQQPQQPAAAAAQDKANGEPGEELPSAIRALLEQEAAAAAAAPGPDGGARACSPADGGPATPAAAAQAVLPVSRTSVDSSQGLGLLEDMALLSPHPLLALMEAPQLIAQHAGADVVAVYSYMDGDPDCAALLAASSTGGDATSTLERSVLVQGPEWSARALLASPRGRLSFPDAARADGPLPDDMAALRREAGMASFEAVAVRARGGEPLGALLVGSRRRGAFVGGSGDSLPFTLTAAATSLLQLLRQDAVARAARLLRPVNEAEGPVEAIAALLEGAARFMWRATNLPMVIRLAVLMPAEQPGAAPASALVFESPNAVAGPQCRRESVGTDARGAAADVTVCQLSMANTLLARAAHLKQAVTIRDTTAYLQNSQAPARDIFSQTTDSGSVAVVPLLSHDTTLGALYFCPAAPNDFSNLQDTLVGFVGMISPTVHNKLSGQAGRLAELVAEAKHGVPAPSLVPLLPVEDGAEPSPKGLRPQTPEAEPATPGGSQPASRLAVVNERRLATDSMVKVLQREIRHGRRHSGALAFMSDLTFTKPIGRGGYGSVWAGTWRNLPAAIKIMNVRANDGEAVSDAMEMAVLSSVAHPHIVQLYVSLSDLVVAEDDSKFSASFCGAADAAAALAEAGQAPPRFRRHQPSDGAGAHTFSVVAMELCEGGTLREAVRGGAFHSREAEGAPIQVDVGALVEVLSDIANALQHLHDVARLVHGDVKLDNVLLKKDAIRALGFTPKLSDFGLAKVIGGGDGSKPVINRSGAGTVTHMPPEMFRAGSKITPAIDAYAFGIMMYEALTGTRAYAGMTRDAIINRVGRQNGRPAFPPGAPAEYVSLAAACWATDPAARPSFTEIIRSLRAMRGARAPAAAL